MIEKCFLEARKVELFLQATDDSLQDKLFLILRDKATEGGFTNEWQGVEESILLVVKQQRVRVRGIGGQSTIGPITVSIPPSIPTIAPATPQVIKSIQENTLEELIKGIRDLRIEVTELRKGQKLGPIHAPKEAKGFVRKCMWYDGTDHE